MTEAETLIAASADYRLLRRVPPPDTWRLPAPRGETRRALYIDTETTGLSQETDEVIELAMVPFDYERESGRIVYVDVGSAFSSFRQPSFPIPAASTLVHHISDADVAGHVIDDKRVTNLVSEAQLIIAHNAGFDRPMVEKHWPVFASKHWACSFVDIDWKAEGFGSGKLDYLLLKQGYFYEGHRALTDALAGVFLLTLPAPVTQRLGLRALLDCARRPLRAVRAEDTPFELRELLRQRGYRWDAGDERSARAKAWWILTEDADAEIAWLNATIYPTPRDVPVVNMPATRRYSSRVWSESEAG